MGVHKLNELSHKMSTADEHYIAKRLKVRIRTHKIDTENSCVLMWKN